MKKEKATIKLVLRTNKTLANGEHPIMLRVNWQGKRAEKATGYSCRVANWSSTSECIKLVGKDMVPNAKKINAVIQNMKNEANEILNKLIYEGKDYSAQMIIDYLSGNSNSSVVRDFNGLVDEYISVNRLKLETILSIRGIQKHFLDYLEKENVHLIDVKKTHAAGFGRWCSEKGFRNNTIRTNIQKLKALFRYAEEIEAIPSNPFKFFNEGKVYKAETNKQALTKDIMCLFKQFYLRRVAELGANAEKKFLVVGNKIFDERILNKMRYATSAINKNLKEIWKEYNMWVKEITEEYEGVPLPSQGIYVGYFEHRLVHELGITNNNIEKYLISDNTTLYSARHTFATIFINSEGAKTTELAQMMGRSVSGIDRYIKDLMGVEDVLKARDKME